MEADKIIAGLKKQRSTNKAKLTNLLKYAKLDHTPTNINELTTRLRRVEKLMEEFTEIETRIFTEDPTEESDFNYEESYYSAVSTLNECIRAKNLNHGAVNLDSTIHETQNGETSKVKLPKIHIPPFSGDYSEWQSFYDIYTSTIHESPCLNAVQKFQYLKGLLRGEAAVLLRHITVTEANYIGALNKLKERYDRKKHIINSFIRTFIEQPAIQNSTAANLKRLMDTSDEAIRGLEALGHTSETRDPWLIYILLQKLDDKSRTMWAEHSSDKVNPEFSGFLKFLGRRIDGLETLMLTNKRSIKKPEVRSHVVSDNSKEEVKGRAPSNPTTYQCAMCSDKDHSIFQCSKFQAQNVDERKQFVKQTNRCFNCLSSNHPTFACPSRRRCYICRKKHNTMLHQDEISSNTSQPEPSTSETTIEVTQNLHSQSKSTSTILPTAMVNAVNHYGRIIPCRALLDSGSQTSFITESCVQRLQLPRRNARISVRGIGHSNSGTSKGLVNITIKPDHPPEFSIEALVMSKITTDLPRQSLDIDMNSYAGIKLADPGFDKTSSIDILIGADHFFNLLQNGQIRTGANKPVLQNTVFGWIISGQSDHQKGGVSSLLTVSNQDMEMENIDQSLRRFWEIESLSDSKNKLTPEEDFCEKHFTQNTKRNHQGRLVVKLPFKESPKHLGDSLPSAIQRLRAMERRFLRDPSFAKSYREFMNEYIQLSHMVEVAPPAATESQFYLPHHGVLKKSNNHSKIRVVFDGSSKSSTNISLNDCLAVGPTIQSSLYSIILRFREHKIAVSADVEKMYRQILVSQDDTRYQRIVWRTDQSQPLRHFKLSTVTYGLASASFLATRALKQISDDCQVAASHASHVIANDVYVDDLMTGAEDEDEARELTEKVNKILIGYGFHLRKWKSNSRTILRSTHLDQSIHDAEDKEIHDHDQLSESIKVLGINWNPQTDTFTFTTQLPDSTKYTKRTVLSEASRLFDPLGWVSPVVINFKIFLQMLWADNLDWDDPLPADKQALWNKLRSSLNEIRTISIPRFTHTTKTSKIDIHGFCDASQSAYAAVVYFRVLNPNEEVHIQLISSKTKVAPIKQQTLPRLELCAAVLLTDLITTIKRDTRLKINEIFTWTDSQIVLDWLGSHPRRWSTFVGNRTSAILSNSTRKNWRHVPSAENPADCASRGLSPAELKAHAQWWNGPNWLQQSIENWPPQKQNYGHLNEKSKEKVTVSHICTASDEWFEEIINKYSSFNKLQRVLGYICRFIGNASKPKISRVHGNYLQREELFHVTRIICKHEQSRFYKDDLAALQSNGEVSKRSSLKSLNPFLDGFEILRVGGRLHNSLAPYSTKHPIILHPKSTITQLILRDIHLENKHAGPSLLLSITRQEYWIPNGKFKSKEVIRKCVTCAKIKSQCQQQLMGSLPRARVELRRPFLKTGVDYAGPILIHLTKGRGQKTYKAYICLFICLSTKAVHLELVNEMSSDAFLGALKRFVARRGVCSDLHTDNGTNFVGADRKLKETFNKLIKESNNISNYLSRSYITWHFIPPSSPHFGGIWEAAIKSTKFHLKRVIGKTILTLEEINTLLAEVESILNSRPLCVINDTDVDPLTPSHFLIGHPHTKIPESDITHRKTSHLNRWQMVQQISQHFWKRWHVEYLTSLQQRTKWRTQQSPVKIEDIVIIQDKNLPVNQWLLGRVTQLHPGSDGLVRVVTLKTQHNYIKRPVNKICVLPTSQEDSIDE